MISELSTILGVFGGYIITSLVLFKYPHILHKRKHVAFIARHISHRGGAGENYENTMAAFKRVIDMGTDMLEMDCQMTKDGRVVVAHDNNLARLAGIDVNISSLSYNELPLLQKAVPIDFVPGMCFEHEKPEEADRRIPLLEDVFKAFSNIPINIDIKENNDALIQGVASLIARYNRERYCVWGNVSAEITEKCYKQASKNQTESMHSCKHIHSTDSFFDDQGFFLMNSEVNILCSKRRVLIILLCYYTGLLPFVPLKETHFEIFLPSIYSRFDNDWKYNTILKIIEKLLIRKSLFNHLKKRGMHVYLWVLNEENEFKQAFHVGATGVMTDYPSRLTDFMDRNKSLIYDGSEQPLPTNAF